MKRIIYTAVLATISIEANAQNNVGINTNSPQASLDFRGTQRVGGNNNYIRYDSATGRIEWVGLYLFEASLKVGGLPIPLIFKLKPTGTKLKNE